MRVLKHTIIYILFSYHTAKMNLLNICPLERYLVTYII